MKLPSAKTNHVFCWLIAGLLLETMTACNGCNRRPAAADAPAPEVKYPARVHVVVDNSLSMGGYFQGATEFKRTVSEMAADLERLSGENRGLEKVDYALAADHGTLRALPIGTGEFIGQMRANGLIQGGDSLLVKAFENILRTTGPDEVSVFVSDSIVSYPDADVRSNPKINKDSLSGLGAEIETVFAHAAKDRKTATLLAGLSSFDGTYYNYSNAHVPVNGRQRPFYVWVLGPAEKVGAIAGFLDGEHLPLNHEIVFGRKTDNAPAAVLQTLRRAGSSVYYRGRGKASEVEIRSFPKTGPITFAVALDLHGLPASMQAPEFLRSHLQVSDPAHAASFANVATRTEVEGEKGNDAGAVLPKYTHVVFVSVQPSVPSGDEITIGIDSALPDWYRLWSNADDSDVGHEKTPTTFGLEALVDGAASAYRENGPVMKSSVTVKR